MSATQLIDRLSRVKQVARGRWLAACPAHLDKSPSLSIREIEDGRVLLHDFGGCDVRAVLAAVGLTVADLFPEKLTSHAAPTKPNHWHARREAFETIHRECFLVAIAGENLAGGMTLTREDLDRVALAASRIRAAVEVCR